MVKYLCEQISNENSDLAPAYSIYSRLGLTIYTLYYGIYPKLRAVILEHRY